MKERLHVLFTMKNGLFIRQKSKKTKQYFKELFYFCFENVERHLNTEILLTYILCTMYNFAEMKTSSLLKLR